MTGLPVEMVEAAARALAGHWGSVGWIHLSDDDRADFSREADLALVAAGVPALLEEREALIEERDRLRDAVIDVAIEQYQRGGSE